MKRRSGYLINLVGAGVDGPHLYTTAYDASKGGLVRLTEALAAEAAEFGVKAFTLFPGTVETKMTDFIRRSPEGRKWRPTFESIFASHYEMIRALCEAHHMMVTKTRNLKRLLSRARPPPGISAIVSAEASGNAARLARPAAHPRGFPV